MRIRTVFIYGLYHRRKCIYVGASVNPEQRFSTHRSSARMRPFRPLKLKVFRSCLGFEEADRLEAQVTHAMLRRGQASENRRLSSPVKCETTGAVYMSHAAAARALGVSVSGISSAVSKSKFGGLLTRNLKLKFHTFK